MIREAGLDADGIARAALAVLGKGARTPRLAVRSRREPV
jgi:hypothetical protein